MQFARSMLSQAKDRAVEAAGRAKDMLDSVNLDRLQETMLQSTAPDLGAGAQQGRAAFRGGDPRLETETGRALVGVSYVTDRCIAMGFPSAGVKGTPLRGGNRLEDVVAYLEEHHAEHYMIFNLSEESYDYSVLNNQVQEFKFPGHPAPPLGLFFELCNSIESWMGLDEENVAVVHCLVSGRSGAGQRKKRGRRSTMAMTTATDPEATTREHTGTYCSWAGPRPGQAMLG